MKRTVSLLSSVLLTATTIIILSSCSCEHEWEKPTCTESAFCTLCGETNGEAMGHSWLEATCTEPKTCSVCSTTDGEVLEHSWIEAICTEPKTCSVCNATEGEALGHSWLEATCTEPKTCSVCSTTDGEALEHSWSEATCTKPKICSLCNTTDGEALGHSVQTWETTEESSCLTTGMQEGVCASCQETISQSLELTEHTPGEWTVTKEATSGSEGERSQSCMVCSEVLTTESFTLSDEEIKQQYMDKCQTYTYNEIARNPSSYDGKYAKFTGEVIQVQRQDIYGLIIYTLRVDVTKKGYKWYDDTVYVTYYAGDDESKILEDDIIDMYGKLTGEKTYTTVWGNSITIPSFTAEYIDIK